RDKNTRIGCDKMSELKWVTSITPRNEPYVVIDKHLRIYFSITTQELLGLNQGKRFVHLGYDPANKRIIVAAANTVRPANVKPHRIDDRGYTSARPFVRQTGIKESELPLKYDYVGKDDTDYPQGSFAFQLEDYAEDDGKL